ncbi:MAG: glycosyltransferase family A protein [Acidobacteriaceae bacterium]|nr:glycosyltransferase family A protein [Acidobacteriaceae bacterium]
MRLSFVVPAYNEEMYLPACLESILAQTQGMSDAVEIIVVNNASTDRTREVALGYPGVRVVDEMRKGLTFARQAGFAASTGELIANVDSDSRLTPGWVAQVLAGFAEEPKMVALSGPFVYYDLTPRQRVSVQGFYAVAFLVYALNRYVLRAGSMVQGGNFVLRREALEKIGGFDTSIAFYGEDTDIARRLNSVGQVKFTFDLKMYSSARRLKEEGMVTIAWRYTLNYLWTTFRKKPYTEEYSDIREKADGIKPSC